MYSDSWRTNFWINSKSFKVRGHALIYKISNIPPLLLPLIFFGATLLLILEISASSSKCGQSTSESVSDSLLTQSPISTSKLSHCSVTQKRSSVFRG